MRLLRAVIFLLALAPLGALGAQNRTAAATVDATKLALIKQLLQETGAVTQALVAMETAIPIQRAANPDIPPVYWSRFLGEARAARQELEERIIVIYDKHFTVADLRAIIAFYETPIGRRMIRAQPAIARESMTAGEEWGKRLAERVNARLEAEGIEVP